MIADFLHSYIGGLIISILWGLGLAVLFRRVCVSRECIEIYGPPPQEVHNKKVRWDNKCYIIEPKEASCDDPDTRIVPIRSN